MLRAGQTFYKIMDTDSQGNCLSLFHGTGGTRVHPTGRWLTCNKKWVADGPKSTSRSYLSGFHVMDNLPDTMHYLRKFKNRKDKIIVACRAGRLRKKEHSPAEGLWLAEAMYISRVVLTNNQVKDYYEECYHD